MTEGVDASAEIAMANDRLENRLLFFEVLREHGYTCRGHRHKSKRQQRGNVPLAALEHGHD